MGRRQGHHLSLAASILSSCFLLTQAQGKTEIHITVDPNELTEGQNVTLTAGSVGLKRFHGCTWFRGPLENKNRIFTYVTAAAFEERLNGPAFTGRETVDPLCSLRITLLMLNDSGMYTLTLGLPVIIGTGTANLTVSASLAYRSTGALTGTVIGSLAAILVLMGTLTYVFLRVHHRKDKTSTTTSAATPTPQIYENILPPGQRKPEEPLDSYLRHQCSGICIGFQFICIPCGAPGPCHPGAPGRESRAEIWRPGIGKSRQPLASGTQPIGAPQLFCCGRARH